MIAREPERMRCAVIAAPGEVQLTNRPIPAPGPGQVRVRVEGCGVCGSDLPMWEGRPWFRYPAEPGAPGHEAWGRVHATGPGVEGLAPGERVAFLSTRGYAEYDLADAAACVPLPRAMDDQPFPGEPLACAMNVLRRSRIRAGQTVAVVGVGFLGAVMTRLASRSGARVIAVSRRAFALETARRCGAAAVVELADTPSAAAEVMRLTDGRGCEVVIEATGRQAPLDLAGDITGTRGRLVIAGYHQDGPRQVNLQMWNWKGLDVINAHERDPAVYVEGIRAALQAALARRMDPRAFFTHTFPLERLQDAFAALRDRPPGFLKALVAA